MYLEEVKERFRNILKALGVADEPPRPPKKRVPSRREIGRLRQQLRPKKS